MDKFIKQDTQIRHKYMERYSISLVIKNNANQNKVQYITCCILLDIKITIHNIKDQGKSTLFTCQDHFGNI